MSQPTPFGLAVRILRTKYRHTITSMASGLGLSIAYVSGVEIGRYKLSRKHIQRVAEFFESVATSEELEGLYVAADKTFIKLDLSTLSPENRLLVRQYAENLNKAEERGKA